MPQGRRKVPFSAKQKKIQLQQKREQKRSANAGVGSSGTRSQFTKDSSSTEDDEVSETFGVTKVIENLAKAKKECHRYRLLFKKESEEEIQRRKAEARKPYTMLSETVLEVSYEDVYMPGSELDMPKRPPWNYSMAKEELETREYKYFKAYLENIEQNFKDEELSYFEMNLETWRQLWRVLEMSDIVLLIVDIRHPVFHFPPTLYDYVTNDLKKDIILVLNKIDLVPPPLVAAWKSYFVSHFPKLHVVLFASYAGMGGKSGKRGRRQGKLKMAATGALGLYQACKEIVKDAVDISSWQEKIEEEMQEQQQKGNVSGDHDSFPVSKMVDTDKDTSYYQGERFKDGVLTIGCVGHPNVGKSSLLNALMGRKVVSVSCTPGHTKHFQTIFLTPKVKLCDCPGLVFPSRVPKAMQVLTGCFPIAQLREPYSVITFLAQRIPLPQLLRIRHPDQEGNIPTSDLQWTAYDICEAWAGKLGFRTARAARYDTYRAANHLLKMALDGRTICLSFYPPGYTKDKEMWSSSPLVQEVEAVLNKNNVPEDDVNVSDVSGELTDTEDEESTKEGDGEEEVRNESANGVDTDE